METDPSGLDILIRLLAVLLLVGANGFFVASEFSLVTVRRTRIKELVKEGRPFARAVERALDDIDAYIAAAQLGITMASLALGWIGEPAIATLIEPWLDRTPIFDALPDWASFATAHGVAILVAFTMITALHISLGEIAPKTMAIQRPERASLLIATPTRWFLQVFKPFIVVLNWISSLAVRPFGFDDRSGERAPHTEEELKMIVTASTRAGVLAPEEEDMIHRVFQFADLTASQLMIPRTEVVGVPLAATREEIEATLSEHGYTRYPVYDGSLDNVVGVVSVKDLLPLLVNGAGAIDLRPVLQPSVVLPASIRVFQLLETMQAERRVMVTLIDEFGGTAGIVTLRDVLERVVGPVEDNDDDEWVDIEIVSDREALVDGLLLIPDLNERFDLEIDDEEYHTVGGYAFGVLGRRPELGDEITAPGCSMVIEALDGVRVSRLRVYREKPTS